MDEMKDKMLKAYLARADQIIGKRTPAEIAVSILAEVIAVRHGVALAQKKPGSAMPAQAGLPMSARAMISA